MNCNMMLKVDTACALPCAEEINYWSLRKTATCHQAITTRCLRICGGCYNVIVINQPISTLPNPNYFSLTQSN